MLFHVVWFKKMYKSRILRYSWFQVNNIFSNFQNLQNVLKIIFKLVFWSNVNCEHCNSSFDLYLSQGETNLLLKLD